MLTDPQPSWLGYSTGKWDGDTLVVQTAGFRDGLWADNNGTPLTGAAKVTERFRRPDFGHMQIDFTLDDLQLEVVPSANSVNAATAPAKVSRRVARPICGGASCSATSSST